MLHIVHANFSYFAPATEMIIRPLPKFADETSLSVFSKDLPDIERIINYDLRIISAWTKQWLVDFNPAKILFTLFDNVQNPQLYFDNILINFVDNYKYLGVTLNHGKWHAKYNILRSVSKMLGVLCSLKLKLQRKTYTCIFLILDH